MNCPEAAIRRMLFYVVTATMLIGVTQVGIIARRLSADSGISLSGPLLLTLLVLLLLLVTTVVVMLRARRLMRVESKIWLTPGLDRQVFDHAPAGMLLSSANGRVRAANAAYTRLTGFTAIELLGRIDDFQHAGSLAGSRKEEMNTHLHVDGLWKGEMWVRKPSGEALGFNVTRIALQDGELGVQAYLTLCQETSSGNEAHRLMLWQAHHDTLTKLPNSNLFHERLSQFLVTRHAIGAVLSINLDGFANVNDSMGFSAGDQVLMEAGHRVAMAVRETDTVARTGGDQFAVLLAGLADDGELAMLASAVVDSMSAPFAVRGRELFVTASTGALSLDGASGDVVLSSGEVMQRADSARAQASQAGGNRCVFYEPAMNELALVRYELEMALRRALIDAQLELYYQPLVDQFQGTVVSFEALLRWHHPERGFVSPVEFIPIAEETGLIVDIGIWVVEQAHEQLRQWAASGFSDLRLSVNISTRQLRDASDVRKLIAALRAPETSRLTLEITESLLMADQNLYREFLAQARDLGAKIALDDFGTGYSSLSYLRDYRFDVLKIDRSFVSALSTSRAVGVSSAKPEECSAGEAQRLLADRNLVASIVSLGKILDMEVVAEGVEGIDELDVLAELGCGLIQGYYYAKPMPAAAAQGYLYELRATGMLRLVEQQTENAA